MQGPRHGLTKGTTMTEYAAAWVVDHEPPPTEDGQPITDKELLTVFEELLNA